MKPKLKGNAIRGEGTLKVILGGNSSNFTKLVKYAPLSVLATHTQNKKIITTIFNRFARMGVPLLNIFGGGWQQKYFAPS